MTGAEILAAIVAKLSLDSLMSPERRRRRAIANAQDEVAAELVKAAAVPAIEAAKRGELEVRPDGKAMVLAWAARQAELAESATDLSQTIEASLVVQLSDAVRRMENVAGALAVAKDTLDAGETAEESKPPPDDWLFRWRDYAGEVGSEEMQSLWGKILAGEVRAPKSFCLRTLEFVRNLSPEEAREIGRLAPLVHGDVLYRDNEYLEAAGFNFSTLMDLQDIGVISGVEALGLNFSMNLKAGVRGLLLRMQGDALTVTSETDQKIEVPMYKVTKVGMEVFKLGAIGTDDGIILAMVKSLQSSKPGLKFHRGKIDAVSATTFKLSNIREIVVES